MDRSTFEKAVLSYYNFEELTPMMESQIKKLLNSGHSYINIYRALWYFHEVKDLSKDSVPKFGFGILSNPKNMEESINYFNSLQKRRENARKSAEFALKQEVKITEVKRQQRKIIREEFDWDEQ